MAYKRKEKTVYEYFKTDDMYFVGKHKDYIDQLWKLNQIQDSYVKRLVDLYAIAAIVGLRTGKKSPEDKEKPDGKRTIQMKQLNENYQVLITIMRMILIMDNSQDLTIEEKLEKAFIIPEDREVYQTNMELFNSYARGGIEYLYEKLYLKKTDIADEYTERRIANMMAFIENPLEKDEIV